MQGLYMCGSIGTTGFIALYNYICWLLIIVSNSKCVFVLTETAPSPCDKNIPDTKVFNKNWILSKMKAGECPCDREHMRHCSRVRSMVQVSCEKQLKTFVYYYKLPCGGAVIIQRNTVFQQEC